ncbi:hypothetical protein [Saccharothrix luteola]|uniref:hypothetical protein n=1 Tax=Saccharothrix luteola TaxID=2893018 RepID=UPI001E5E51D3|nr:hypothetical protein [Saccharothrix luteola]MCC8251614.1 hypothetical protein [Saccharothrix luteola]
MKAEQRRLLDDRSVDEAAVDELDRELYRRGFEVEGACDPHVPKNQRTGITETAEQDRLHLQRTNGFVSS